MFVVSTNQPLSFVLSFWRNIGLVSNLVFEVVLNFLWTWCFIFLCMGRVLRTIMQCFFRNVMRRGRRWAVQDMEQCGVREAARRVVGRDGRAVEEGARVSCHNTIRSNLLIPVWSYRHNVMYWIFIGHGVRYGWVHPNTPCGVSLWRSRYRWMRSIV